MKVQSISTTPSSFKAAPGEFINPKAFENKNYLKMTLQDSLTKTSNIVDAIDWSIKRVYPNMNFVLSSMDGLKSLAPKKYKPTIETITTYQNNKPLSFFFLNATKLVNVLNDAKDDIYGYPKRNALMDDISDKVTLANEPHFITEVITDFISNLFVKDDTKTKTVNNAINETLFKYDINIDNEVLDKKLIKQKNTSDSDIGNLVLISKSEENIQTKMYIDENMPEAEQFSILPHNLCRILSENSKLFNDFNQNIYQPGSNIEPLFSSFKEIFTRIESITPNMLDWPEHERYNLYSTILDTILEPIPSISGKILLYKQIMNEISQQALAYLNMPPILHPDYEDNYICMDKYFKDFHQYMCETNPTDYFI